MAHPIRSEVWSIRRCGLIEYVHLGLCALILTSLVVCAGAVLQTATGMGLGLLAGPVLILSLPGETAIFVAIVLNLAVSLALLPQEHGEIAWPPLRLLLIGTLIGVPLGWLALRQIDPTALKLFTGIVVLAAAGQLLLLRRQAAARDEAARLRNLGAGGLSGFMTGCLAIPGPVALWVLLRQDMPPTQLRATLRALFVFSYGTAFIAHAGWGGAAGAGWHVVATLAPALVAGIVLGGVVKRKVGEATLQVVLRLILLAMGLSLLWQGIAEATA